jgi:hypothetical protein
MKKHALCAERGLDNNFHRFLAIHLIKCLLVVFNSKAIRDLMVVSDH